VSTHLQQRQESAETLNFSRSAPTPQHGARADKEALKKLPRRTWKPKQQH
jgi:hypothetical protein